MAIKIGDAVLTFEGDLNPLKDALRTSEDLSRKSFEAIEQATRKAAEGFAQATRRVEEWRSKNDDAKRVMDEVRKALDAARDAAKQAGDGLGGAGKTVKELEGELKKAHGGLDQAKKGLDASKDAAFAFTASVREMRQGVREAESNLVGAVSQLKAAKGALDEAKNSGTATAREIQTLERNVASAEKAVGRASAELDKKRTALSNTAAQSKVLNDRVKESQAAYTAASTRLQQVTASLESARAGAAGTGKSIAELEREFKKAETEVQRTESALKRNEQAMRDSEQAAKRLGAEYRSNTSGLRGLNHSLEENRRVIQQNYGAVMDSARRVGMIVTAMGASVVGAMGLMIRSNIEYESAFAGVRKTVDASEEEFQALSAAFVDLSTKIPASAVELARIGELAGQLGVDKDHILEFTQTIAGLGVATNMTQEEAAVMFAQFANITSMDFSELDNLASSLVDLGNNSAATEKMIMEMAMRIAGAGTTAGMAQSEILGVAAALTSLGIQAERGGTAFSQLLIKMVAAVRGEALPAEEIAKLNEELETLTTSHNTKMEGLTQRFQALGEQIRSIHEDTAREQREAAIRARIQEARRLGHEQYAQQLEAQLQREREMLRVARRQEQLAKLQAEQNAVLEQMQREKEEYEKVSKSIRDELNQNVKALEIFARVSGVSVGEFKDLFERDATGAVVAFLKGLQDIDKAGGDVAGTMAEMGMGGIRLIDTILRTTNAGDLFSDSIARGNKAFEENIALAVETARRYETVESQMSIWRNGINALALDLREVFLPPLNQGLQYVQGLVGRLREWMQTNPEVVQSTLLVVGAIGAVLAVLGPLLILLPGLVLAVTGLKAAFLAVSPAALAVAAVVAGALTLALSFARDYWAEIVAVFQASTDVAIGIVKVFGELLQAAFNLVLAVVIGFGKSQSEEFAKWLNLSWDESKSFVENMRQFGEELRGRLEMIAVGISDWGDWVRENFERIAGYAEWFSDNFIRPIQRILYWLNELARWVGPGAVNRIAGEILGDLFFGGEPVPGYAEGGRVEGDGRQARVIVAGEEGPELAKLPGGGWTILGGRGPGLFQVPVGTFIKTADETRQALVKGATGKPASGGKKSSDKAAESTGRPFSALWQEFYGGAMDRIRVLRPQLELSEYMKAVSIWSRLNARDAANAQTVAHKDGKLVGFDATGSSGWIMAPDSGRMDYLMLREQQSRETARAFMASGIPGFARGGLVRASGTPGDSRGRTERIDLRLRIDGPIVIREEADIRRLSQSIAREIRGGLGGALS